MYQFRMQISLSCQMIMLIKRNLEQDGLLRKQDQGS